MRGELYQLVDAIISHRSDDNVIKRGEEWIVSKNGKKHRRPMSKGWYFELMWKDGTSSWVPLKEIKETHPIEVAEYASHENIIHEPALAWGAPHVLKKRDRIIAKVKSRSKKKNSKYGITIPTSVADALRLDKENGNTY